MNQTTTMLIDGEPVQVERLTATDDYGSLGMRFLGPQVYSGHIHGHQAAPISAEWCFPNVVDSVAWEGDAPCDRRPAEFGDSIVAAVWYVPEASDVLL